MGGPRTSRGGRGLTYFSGGGGDRGLTYCSGRQGAYVLLGEVGSLRTSRGGRVVYILLGEVRESTYLSGR